MKRRYPEEIKTAVAIPPEYFITFGNKVYAYKGKILTGANESEDRAIQILIELEELDNELGLRTVRELAVEAAEKAGVVSGFDFEILKTAKERADAMREELRGLKL
ncbi:MAG: hypothetical protein LBH43_19885 [Treponema sp.]|nr:hypothetical protein [Treponema sp.]